MRIDDLVVPPQGGELVWLKGLGARYLITSEQTGGRLAVVEHPIKPRALASPMHTHTREDEISFVIAGRVGVQIGDQVIVAEPGTIVFKPRGIPHAFWNESEEQARVLEMISPAGFDAYFREMAAIYADSTTGLPDPQRAAALYAKYGLELDVASIPQLIQAHNLRS
ncbi:MAG TPA: cupin domain-containing protein [Ktedonobacterales bacterium]|jgi:quercetin dioxygenase-like cupin family protein